MILSLGKHHHGSVFLLPKIGKKVFVVSPTEDGHMVSFGDKQFSALPLNLHCTFPDFNLLNCKMGNYQIPNNPSSLKIIELFHYETGSTANHMKEKILCTIP